jgi:FkbH-like protein
MFDTTCANKRCGFAADEILSEIPDEPLLSAAAAVGGIVWEEHCVECGQPECFQTCRMFERSFDGKCKRFDNGIVPVKAGGRRVFVCDFRKWAKLEGHFTGGLTTPVRDARLSAVDRIFAFLARTVNRAMSFVPGRIGAITVYRRLKLWASRFANRGATATVSGLVLRGRASRKMNLHLSVIQGEETVHDEVFALNGEWQTFSAAFRPVGAGTRFLLFATDDLPFTLAIETLEILPAPVALTARQESSKPAKGGAAPAMFVKCLAWDLDNTLWKGILVEDGPDRLVVNEDAVALVKTLDSRGILNTVCSKNDYEPAWKQLEKLGLAEYFVFPAINWLPKSANLKASAKAINIGLDTFAFVDDSPFERGEVAEHLPMVRVFKNTEIADLANRPEFNPPVSGEGSKRRLSYQKEMQRVAAAQAFVGDYAAFLRSCEIVLELFPLRGAEAAVGERCYELIQRTNQLTLAARRYTPEQFAALVARDGAEAWGIRCRDRFGDYGVIGVVVARREAEALFVEEFVMSCRVAKKQCEYSVLRALAERARADGAAFLRARIVQTGRNTALVAAFDEMPFAKTVADDKALDYEMKLGGVALPEAVNKVVFQ